MRFFKLQELLIIVSVISLFKFCDIHLHVYVPNLRVNRLNIKASQRECHNFFFNHVFALGCHCQHAII